MIDNNKNYRNAPRLLRGENVHFQHNIEELTKIHLDSYDRQKVFSIVADKKCTQRKC